MAFCVVVSWYVGQDLRFNCIVLRPTDLDSINIYCVQLNVLSM